MKIFKISLALPVIGLLSACAIGPDKSRDRGIDAKPLSELQAGIWVDPNGCVTGSSMTVSKGTCRPGSTSTASPYVPAWRHPTPRPVTSKREAGLPTSSDLRGRTFAEAQPLPRRATGGCGGRIVPRILAPRAATWHCPVRHHEVGDMLGS